MKTSIIVFLIAAMNFSAPASAATAFWTGRLEQSQSVTGMFVYECEYMYAGQTFWRAFPRYCPAQVEVY